MLHTIPHAQTGKPSVTYPVARKLTGWGLSTFKKRVDGRYGATVPLGILQDIFLGYEGTFGLMFFYKRCADMEQGIVR